MNSRAYSLYLLSALLAGLWLTLLLVNAQARADAAGMASRRAAWSEDHAARLNQLETTAITQEVRLAAQSAEIVALTHELEELTAACAASVDGAQSAQL